MRKSRPGGLVVAGLAGLVVLGLAALLAAGDTPRFSEWSVPVNLGPVVNSISGDAGAFISKDGLSLYFGSSRPGGFGGLDIYVSRRATLDEPWGAPQNLGSSVNTSSEEQTPTLSPDGHRLYFASNRPGGFGGPDLYVSRRHNKRDDIGWRPPVNLGSGVNTSATDYGPALFEDDESGTITLYFSSDRQGLGLEDIFASTLQEDETFGLAVLVEELSSPDRDVRPAIRKDGLEMLLDSSRPGTLGGLDLWVSTRAGTSDPWSTPESLGPVVNSTASVDARPALSFDGTELYFHSNRPGGLGGNDLYRSTRTKLKDED